MSEPVMKEAGLRFVTAMAALFQDTHDEGDDRA